MSRLIDAAKQARTMADLDLENAALRSRITALEAELAAKSKWLGEMLAIIHRDGGHHQSAVGDEQAVKDAHLAWAATMVAKETAEAELDAEKAQVAKLREAVEPFAPIEEVVTGAADDDEIELWFPDGGFIYRLKWAVFRRARRIHEETA